MMRKWSGLRILLLAAAGMASISCAFGDRHITLTYPMSPSRSEVSGPGRLPVRLNRFADGRSIGSVVGEAFGKNAKPGSVWYLDNDLGEFLKEALASELKDAGVAVAPGGGGDTGESFRVEGKVNVFYGWAASADAFFTAAINIDVSLLAKTRPVFIQSYVSQKTTGKINPDCQALLGMATSEVMKQAAGDIRDFLRKEGDREK